VIPRIVGVRTEDWKLVRYPDLDDVDELYDLHSDPHELKSLVISEVHRAKHEELGKELDRLMKETGYHETKWKPLPLGGSGPGGKLVLSYDFAGVTGNTVPDVSGTKNVGQLTGGAIVPGRTGGQTLKLDGKGCIEVPTSPSLNLTRHYWTYEAWIKPEADGVVVARGGHNLGLILFLEDGKPSFAVRNSGRSFVAQAKDSVLGQWVHVAGVFDRGFATIYVNGEVQGRVTLSFRAVQDPKETMQIGVDLSTPVDPVAKEGRFRGLIDSVRVYSRALTPEEILAAAR
jgi:hypothetical protein